jgi:hypothetical protein
MAEGFLGRWSQRKLARREGRPVQEVSPDPVIVPLTEPLPEAALQQGMPPVENGPPLSLADVQALQPESDFAPFVARDVAPDVRNAAMKKLFADPHYNVMDRLDTYIDDYSRSDPIPESMLRQMVSARFLQLFDDQQESTQPEFRTANQVPPADTHHDHTDLRLQPNHAAGGEEPGRSAE